MESQNNINRPHIKKKSAHSKYRGVTLEKRINKWQTQIRINGKHKIIGYFNDEIEAAKAYDKAARKHHKEFAVLNFPKLPKRNARIN